MKGFLLFIIALVGLIVAMPISIIVALVINRLDFMAYAISIDQTINAVSGPLLDSVWLIDSKNMRFGNMDRTISYNLGRNKKYGNLNRFGLWICDILHLIDENHVEKAYQNQT
jgi:hypothetical protein